jgi:hypothetical protein
MTGDIPVQINNRMRGGLFKMHNVGTIEKRTAFRNYGRRKVLKASNFEKAFDQVNRTLGVGMTWVAGLSMFYLLVHILRWMSNG